MDRQEMERNARIALAAGDIEGALELYQRLELSQDEEPTWSRQVANLHQQLGNKKEAVRALSRAAERCAARKEPLKAIVAAKMALAIEPTHIPTLTVLQRILQPLTTQDPPPFGELTSDLDLPEPDEQPLAVIPLLRRSTRDQKEEGGMRRIPIRYPDYASTVPHIPLFSSLGGHRFEDFIAHSRLVFLAGGAALFREGDVGDSVFVIVEGTVSVFREGPPRRKVAELGEGDFFGEIGVFTDRPRGATVEALYDTELLEVSRSALTELMRAQPSVLFALLRFLRERVVENLWQISPFFRRFSSEERRALVQRFHLIDVMSGTRLIREGATSRGIYVLVDGELEVSRKSDSGADQLVATLEPGHICGEISAITTRAAVASVTATKRSLVLMLSEHDVAETITAHPELLRYAKDLASERLSELGLDATVEDVLYL